MSIDVKELRIGSHVDVNGERCRVNSVSNPWVFVDRVEDVYTAHEDELEPIPLSPELLKEMGFEEEDWHGMTLYRKQMTTGSLLNEYVVASELKNNPNDNVFEVQFGARAMMDIRYLHELENIMYLTFKEELIKD